MKSTRSLTLILSLLTLTLPGALATSPTQNPNLGPNITRMYTTAQLSTQEGLLQIGKDELWMLNFPDTVTDVLTTRDGVLDTKMMGNTVAVAAILNSGTLPMAIKLANGMTQYFLITLSASRGGGIKNIVVTDPSADSNNAAISSASASSDGGSDARATTPTRPAAQTPASKPPTSTPRPQTPAVTPSAPAWPVPAAQTTQMPAIPAVTSPQPVISATNVQLPLQAQFALQQDGQTLVLYYRLNNPSTGTYLLNDQQLHVSVSGQLLAVNGRGALSLPAGGSTYGTVSLSAAGITPGTPLAVEWSALQQATGTVTVLRSFVNVPMATGN
ncbi:hypothetical protein [Deinococcus ruber]|uniref:Uncharacterized protein n=1 Tax=Deinococcus ruber TaxID=1848197 RepID=A0A918C7J6_9DEIO|nr:hypothetical protein [Deinococcus ruber]GGR09784.1 hypothetical protein GCM10008957_23180 [Deinococcus ruber]